MSKPLWRISIITSAEAEEAVSELLSSTFGVSCTAYHDFETGKIMVSIFTKEPTLFREARPRILRGLRRIRECGLCIISPRVTCRKVRQEDWAESWKRHFKPIEIGRKLLVKPSWSRRRAKRGEIVIILDPGLSFGTGHHPTTSFCLQELVRFGTTGGKGGLLDAGTGSGILAIAAAKLGFSPVDAFDFDAEALRIARANALGNGVGRRIDFFRQDATKFRSTRKYALICANLTAEVLRESFRWIAEHLQRDGRAVLAGILKEEFGSIEKAADRAGLRLLRRRNEKEWSSGTFGASAFAS